jgi:hypothetical protein
MGRVFAHHRSARGVGFADDLNIYASLKTALKVLVEMRQLLGASSRTCAPAHLPRPLTQESP